MEAPIRPRQPSARRPDPQRHHDGNVFFALTSSQRALAFSTRDDDISQFGTADGNRYARPIGDAFIFRTWEAGWDGPAVNRTLGEWKAYSGQDASSAGATIGISAESEVQFEYNYSGQSREVPLVVPMVDVSGVKYPSSITLPPCL